MSIHFQGQAHAGDEAHHYYRQPTAPTASDPLQVGDLWSDTSANLLKRCTSVSPVTFVSVEGGSAAHDLLSATHADVDETDTPGDGEVLTYNATSGHWEAQPAGGHAEDHASRHLAGGGDQLDGDRVDIDWDPTSYTPDATPIEADSVDSLTAHLYGIDQKLAEVPTTTPSVEAPISAASLKGTATGGAGDADGLPESAETPTNGVNYDYMAFDPDIEESAYFQYSIPSGWNEGDISFRVKWTAASGSGGVVFGVKAVALGDGDALDTAFGTEVTVSDSLSATGAVHVTPESSALTVGDTPSEGDIVLFHVSRKAADAADTLDADARLLEVIITFTRDSYTD